MSCWTNVRSWKVANPPTTVPFSLINAIRLMRTGMGAPSRVIISPRLLLRVFPSAIVSFNKLISWDLESLLNIMAKG